MSTYAEIDATLTAPGQPFEIDEIAICGVPTRVWRHTPRSLRAVLEQSLTRGGDTAFLVLGAERLTRSEHHARVVAFARQLVDDVGVRPGDRVVIAMRNYPEWSVAFFGAVAIGAVAVPLNAWWTGEAAMVRRRLDEAASVGITEVIVTPAGPGIDLELERFATARGRG